MALRRSHGRAKELGARIVWETTPADELRAVAPDAAVPPAPRDEGRFTPASASEAARRRWELAQLPDFAEFELRLVPTDDWRPFEVIRRANYDRATREIEETTGGCSRRVRTVLRGWAFLAAAAEYWAAMFVTTGDPRTDERAERRFKAASIELAKAWEFARLDKESRPRRPEQYPWLPPPAPPTGDPTP